MARMTEEEYHAECQKIAQWADEQYRRKLYSEDFIERVVERKFDTLDAVYLFGKGMETERLNEIECSIE